MGEKNKKITSNFKIICNNANGIMSKKESFNNLIKNESPTCFILQETKLRGSVPYKVSGYQIFENRRKDKWGGGVMIGVANNLKNCLLYTSPSPRD